MSSTHKERKSNLGTKKRKLCNEMKNERANEQASVGMTENQYMKWLLAAEPLYFQKMLSPGLN